MKFSRKLVGKRVQMHINKVSHIECSQCPPVLNMHACSRLQKFWTAIVTDSWGRSFQIISSLVRRSLIVDGCCLHFVYKTAKFRNLSKTLPHWCPMVLSLNRMAHRTCNTRLVTRHCNDFIAKHEWPQNSPDLNLLNYHVWCDMLKAYHKLDK